MNYLVLSNWMESIGVLIKHFYFLSFHHIYRNLNVEVDSLSEKELGSMDKKIIWENCSEMEAWSFSMVVSVCCYPRMIFLCFCTRWVNFGLVVTLWIFSWKTLLDCIVLDGMSSDGYEIGL